MKQTIVTIAVAAALVVSAAMAIPLIMNDGLGPSMQTTGELVTTDKASSDSSKTLAKYYSDYNAAPKTTIHNADWEVDVPTLPYVYPKDTDEALLFFPSEDVEFVISYFAETSQYTGSANINAWLSANEDLADRFIETDTDWLDVFFDDDPGVPTSKYNQIDFSNGHGINGYILSNPSIVLYFVYVVEDGEEKCVLTLRRYAAVEEDTVDEAEVREMYKSAMFEIVKSLRPYGPALKGEQSKPVDNDETLLVNSLGYNLSLPLIGDHVVNNTEFISGQPEPSSINYYVPGGTTDDFVVLKFDNVLQHIDVTATATGERIDVGETTVWLQFRDKDDGGGFYCWAFAGPRQLAMDAFQLIVFMEGYSASSSSANAVRSYGEKIVHMVVNSLEAVS